MIFESIKELDDNLNELVAMSDEDIEVRDGAKLREFGIDYLVYSAVLSTDSQTRHLCRVYIRKLAKNLGIYSS